MVLCQPSVPKVRKKLLLNSRCPIAKAVTRIRPKIVPPKKGRKAPYKRKVVENEDHDKDMATP